jgi:hypothetical protein
MLYLARCPVCCVRDFGNVREEWEGGGEGEGGRGREGRKGEGRGSGEGKGGSEWASWAQVYQGYPPHSYYMPCT